MERTFKNNLLRQADEIINYLDGLHTGECTPFTAEEVKQIISTEEKQARANYERALLQFQESNDHVRSPQTKRFVVYWGYPGAGKSFMSQKLIERFGMEENCLPFNIIDKDQHRDLFPNLFSHLKNGHLDECEKFAGITIEYVRQILDISLKKGDRSLLSIGSMGAGSEFKDNAQKALQKGYKPCAVYMSVNPDIAYLSSVYRSADLYDKIIFQNKELYPRLVSDEYFSRVVKMLPEMIGRIDSFQRENSHEIDLMVVNRANEVLYDSRHPHQMNVRDVIEKEESRLLTETELISIHRQLTRIRQNISYRAENGIFIPYANELKIAQTAVIRTYNLILSQPANSRSDFNEHLTEQSNTLTPANANIAMLKKEGRG